MSTHFTVSSTGCNATISIRGKFDYSAHPSFQQACNELKLDDASSDNQNYIIEMRGVDYIDSAGLGMLIMLQNKVGKEASITITGCQPEVKKVLDIANFQELFTIKQ